MASGISMSNFRLRGGLALGLLAAAGVVMVMMAAMLLDLLRLLEPLLLGRVVDGDTHERGAAGSTDTHTDDALFAGNSVLDCSEHFLFLLKIIVG